MENPIPHARSLEQAIGFAELIADGAFLAATCAEDLRFVTEADIRSATDGTFLGDYRVRRQLAACRVWGFGEEVGSDSQQPITVDVPVLLISGAVDPVTSAAGAERVAKALPRAWHIVFPNQSHDSVNRPCEERLRADFITALGGRASTPPVLPKPADRLSSSSRGGPDHVGALRLAT